MKIKVILTDVGGVLVRTENTLLRRAWEDKLDLKPRTLTREIQKIQPAKEATIGLVSAENIWQNISQKYSLDPRELQLLKHDYFAGEKLNQKFYEYLEKIHKSYKIVIFSNAWDDGREVYTKKFHLDKITDQMIISAEEGMRKPHKKFYQQALKKLGVLPEEILYLDDRMENIKVGKAIGFNSILFNYTGHVIDQINEIL
ncbi:MAG TPA: HAD-IA family hydrolase [Candidatus Limnocylindrales bacterium]|nr:HAD-IA family hydrolase [Candidatus Limnocylindrales bacterium]